MTEWLNENARRAYPLAHEAPERFGGLLEPVLLDACVGCDWRPDDGDLRLLDIRKDEDGLVLHIGSPNDAPDASSRQVEVLVKTGTPGRVTLSAAGAHVRALVTVSGPAADALRDSLTDFNWHDVDTPFAVRCCSYANACVTAVEAYTPDTDEQCSHPVFDDRPRTPVSVLTGDVVLKASDGVDLEAIDSPDGSGTVLRVSALAGEINEGASAKTVDLVIRGDACIAVEARPGVRMNANGAETPDPTCGIVVIGSKCKPCCQCDDYIEAVETLRPYDTAAAEIKRLLDEAKEAYETAAKAFDTYKAAALAAVNSYDNLNASAVAVCSSADLYKSATTASGSRSRIAITMTIENMTQDTATISGLEAGCPGYNAENKVDWVVSGSRARAGESVTGLSWRLSPGDMLTVSWTFTKESSMNKATKPSGMYARAQAQLDKQADARTLEPEVK